MHAQRPALFATAILAIAALLILAACAPASAPAPTAPPPTVAQPTAVPPTAVPPTAAPTTTTAPTAAPKPTTAPVAAGPTGSPSGTTSAPAPAPAGPPTGKTTALGVTNNDKFGKILTDVNGMTLYMYPQDTRNPSTSTCYDACAQRWPAFLADASGKFEVKSSDLDSKMFGTTTRKDGSKQVTFNGWPVYYWANDKKPGDTLGQGVGDIWWVMQPDATIITGPTTVAIDIPLGAGRDGEQPGTARLTAKGNQTDVAITVKAGAAGVAQPAHIHDGACPAPGAVKYPLTDVVNGKSKTTVDASLADLMKGTFAINAHLSKADIGKYVACGAIK